MIPLKYLQAYPASLQDQVRQLIAENRLGETSSAATRGVTMCRVTRRCTPTP